MYIIEDSGYLYSDKDDIDCTFNARCRNSEESDDYDAEDYPSYNID